MNPSFSLERAVGRGGVCGCGGAGQGATTPNSHSIQGGATPPCAITTVQSAPERPHLLGESFINMYYVINHIVISYTKRSTARSRFRARSRHPCREHSWIGYLGTLPEQAVGYKLNGIGTALSSVVSTAFCNPPDLNQPYSPMGANQYFTLRSIHSFLLSVCFY